MWNCFWNLKVVMDTMFVCVSNCVVVHSWKEELQVVEFTYWTLGFLHQLASLGPMRINFKNLNTWDIRTWLSIWKVKLWNCALISIQIKSYQIHTKAWDLIPKKDNKLDILLIISFSNATIKMQLPLSLAKIQVYYVQLRI